MYILHVYTCTFNPVQSNHRDGPVAHNNNIIDTSNNLISLTKQNTTFAPRIILRKGLSDWFCPSVRLSCKKNRNQTLEFFKHLLNTSVS